MRFRDIPQFIRAPYGVDVPLDSVTDTIQRYENMGLDLEPDFQRPHVWTTVQQERYVKYLLKGGISARTIYLNHPGWMKSYDGDFVIVDGKQRLKAICDFIHNKVKVFGLFYSEFEGPLPTMCSIRIEINSLQTRAEVLQWYLDLNTGGVVHSDEEIEKVKGLLHKELSRKTS